MEAAPGFEPGIKDLQSHALPLGYAAVICLQIYQIYNYSKLLNYSIRPALIIIFLSSGAVIRSISC